MFKHQLRLNGVISPTEILYYKTEQQNKNSTRKLTLHTANFITRHYRDHLKRPRTSNLVRESSMAPSFLYTHSQKCATHFFQ